MDLSRRDRSNEDTPRSSLDSGSWSYEETVQQVEQMITRIESGKLDLAQVFNEFALAVNYLHQCETFLAERQHQLDLLIETLTDESEF